MSLTIVCQRYRCCEALFDGKCVKTVMTWILRIFNKAFYDMKLMIWMEADGGFQRCPVIVRGIYGTGVVQGFSFCFNQDFLKS